MSVELLVVRCLVRPHPANDLEPPLGDLDGDGVGFVGITDFL